MFNKINLMLRYRMTRRIKLLKKIEYADNANEKYEKFFNYRLACSICKSETNLQWYNVHLNSKKCQRVQKFVYNDDIRDEKIQLIRDKIYFLKYGPEEPINITEDSTLSKEEYKNLMEMKKEIV